MIQQLRLTDFTCFRDTVIDFCPGINVLIGANGTGKTHIMKSLSAILKANEEFQNSPTQSRERLESLIAEKLVNYFKPEQLGRLVTRKVGGGSSKVSVKIKGREISFGFSRQAKASVRLDNNTLLPDLVNSLYLPPREMLSLFEGFLSLYEKREISIDEPYVLLAKALDSNVLKGRRFDEVKALIVPLEEKTGAEVLKENGRFYLKDENGKMEVHLVAEGLRKIATLMHLIANGELSQHSVLFWDEPESNLNPKLITAIADFLNQLAKHGVQIFIATHDFLLTHHLSLASEYRDLSSGTPTTKFFCFSKNEQGFSVFEEGETLAAIDNNPILDEFAAYHDLEQKLFNTSLTS